MKRENWKIKLFFRKSKMREEKSLKKKEMKKYVKTYVNK